MADALPPIRPLTITLQRERYDELVAIAEHRGAGARAEDVALGAIYAWLSGDAGTRELEASYRSKIDRLRRRTDADVADLERRGGLLAG